MSGKDGDFGGCLPGLTAVRTTALTGVLAFAVLADDDPVEIASLAVSQRGLSTLEDSCWAHVGVLLEGLADGEAKTPERNVIRNI